MVHAQEGEGDIRSCHITKVAVEKYLAQHPNQTAQFFQVAFGYEVVRALKEFV